MWALYVNVMHFAQRAHYAVVGLIKMVTRVNA